MATRTFDQIAIDLITYVLRNNPKIDIAQGQAYRDIVINAPASQMTNLYTEIESVKNSQSILNAANMSTNDMNDLAGNFGVVRKTPTKAICQVVFYTPSQPSSDITIPQGTIVGTNAGTGSQQITFSTINTLNFILAQEATFFNVETGNWEITADVQAVNGGSNSNVGPFTINNIINSNIPFQVVNLISATGGTNQENNVDFATRAINTLLGNNKGTKNGYLGTVLSQPNVLDALIVSSGDEFMIRDNGLGGKVDIWVLPSSLSPTLLNSDNDDNLLFNWNLQDESLIGFKFDFPITPVDVNSLPTLVATTQVLTTPVKLFESKNPAGVLTQQYIPVGGFHYTFNKADNFDLAHSVEADDNIIWNKDNMEYTRTYVSNGVNTGTGNDIVVGISYYYDKTIVDLQTLLNSDNNKIITADVLVKQAKKVFINVQANVVLLSDFKNTTNTLNQTLNNITSAVVASINSSKMGKKFEKADLIQTIHNVDGVDNIVLSSVHIQRTFEDVYNGNPPSLPQEIENFTADANEYIVSGSVQIKSV